MYVKIVREDSGQIISIDNTRKKGLAYENLIEKNITYTTDEEGNINLQSFNDIELFRHKFVSRYLINKNKK
jgi:hypothetical protein